MAILGLALAACGGGGGGSGGGGGDGGGGGGAASFSVRVAPGGTASQVQRADVLLVRLSDAAPRGTTARDLFQGAEIVRIGLPEGNGRYRFTLPSGNRDGLVVLAQRIVDGGLAVGRGVELYAPLNLFADGQTVVASPVNTLALLRAGDTGAAALDTARRTLLSALSGRDDQDPLAALPLLAALSLGDYLDNWPSTLAQGAPDLRALLSNLDLEQAPEIYREELNLRRAVALGVLDASASLDGEALAARVNEIEFVERSAAILDASGTAYGESYLEGLAEPVVAALGGASIGGGKGVGNILRYLVNTHELNGALTEPSPAPALVSTIRGDTNLATLAARSAAMPVSVPLLEGELLGMDSERRRLYYLGTEAAPANFVADLFADVTDANITDEVQGVLAAGAAGQGQVDAADFLARTQVFGTEAQAHAYKDAGQALLEIGKTDEAITFLRRGVEIYQGLIDTKGVANMSIDDVTFLQTTIGYPPSDGLLGAGDQEGADRATAPLNAFFDAYGNGAFTGALGRAITAYWRVTDDLMDQALAANLQDPALNSAAEAAVDRLAEVVRSVEAAQAASTRRCETYDGDSYYAVRALYMQRSIAYYAQLGRKQKALDVVNNDLPLIRTNDHARCWAEEYYDDIAVSLVQLGATEEVETLLAGMIDGEKRQAARTSIVVAEAGVLLERGEVQEAIDRVRANTEGGETLIELLYNNSHPGERGLAGTLLDQQRYAEAKQVIDAAWDYVRSSEYQDHIDEQGPEAYDQTYFVVGLGRLVRTYSLAGYPDDADAVLDYLSDVVEERFTQNTAQRARGHYELGRALFAAERAGEANAELIAARDILDGLSSANDARLELLEDILQFQAETGDFSETGFFRTLSLLQDGADALCCEGVGDGQLAERRVQRAQVYTALVREGEEAVYRLRERLWRAQVAGEPVAAAQSTLRQALAESRALLTPAVDAAFALADFDDTDTQLNILFASMASLDAREALRTAAARVATPADRNPLLVNAAKSWMASRPYTNHGDFPGFRTNTDYPRSTNQVLSEAPARVDSDDDGLPDFYSLAAANAATFGLALDPDMDGDGIADTSDRYPLDPQR
ncbi:hypothetical protein MLD55_05225 [Alcanivorax sp. MM125-6]|nr:hypothetical protein [Alcanivorax sp. MM125-6]